MSSTRIGHAATSLLIGTVILGALAAPASARSALDTAKHRRDGLVHQISKAHGRFGRATRLLERQIDRAAWQLAHAPSPRSQVFDRWTDTRARILAERRETLTKLRAINRNGSRRIADLRHRLSVTKAWIARYGIFQTCPVRGWHAIANNFGIMVRRPHVPVHVHQGNDITALYGTPIVAPFAGTAVTAPNSIGGMAVKVYGARGYVYNAHLSRYGKLGSVRAGDVIGYVGVSGDAGGPHDHFEWHPDGGGAVDPYAYLAAVC